MKFHIFKCGCRIPSDKIIKSNREIVRKVRRLTGKEGLRVEFLYCFKHGERLDYKTDNCPKCGEVIIISTRGKRTYQCMCVSNNRRYVSNENRHEAVCPMCGCIHIVHTQWEYIGPGKLKHRCQNCEKKLEFIDCSMVAEYAQAVSA